MSTTESYEFSWTTTPDFSPFVVDFSTAKKSEVPKKGKTGDYISTEWSVAIKSAKISNTLLITGISQKHFERMRVLRAFGLINLTVSRGMAAVGQPASFAPYIISGVA